jgi:hypothetical protein
MDFDLLVVVVDNNSEYMTNARNFFQRLHRQYSNNTTVITLIFISGMGVRRLIAGQNLSKITPPRFKDENSKFNVNDISLWIYEAKSNFNSNDPESVSTAIIVDVNQGHNQYTGLISPNDTLLFYDKNKKSFNPTPPKPVPTSTMLPPRHWPQLQEHAVIFNEKRVRAYVNGRQISSGTEVPYGTYVEYERRRFWEKYKKIAGNMKQSMMVTGETLIPDPTPSIAAIIDYSKKNWWQKIPMGGKASIFIAVITSLILIIALFNKESTATTKVTAPPVTVPPVSDPAVPNIVITKIDFANIDENGKIIGSYGTTFDSSTLKHLSPRITYDSNTSGEITLVAKIIHQSTGKIRLISYDTLEIQADKRGKTDTLTGWKNENGDSYSAGTYTCEILNNDEKLCTGIFTVTATPPSNSLPRTTGDTFTTTAPSSNPPLPGTTWEYINQTANDIDGHRYRLTFSGSNAVTFAVYNRDDTSAFDSFKGTYSLEGNNLTIVPEYPDSETVSYTYSKTGIVDKQNQSIIYKPR